MSFQGTEYVVADQVFQQFKTQYEQAREEAERQQGQQQSFATLGMDPRKWLVDPKTDGEAQVGDTDTVKITAGIDMNALLDDANKALESAAALGATQGQEIPERLTEEQRRQVSSSSRIRGSRSTPARTTRPCAASCSRSASTCPTPAAAAR